MATDKKISGLPAATLPITAGVKFEALQGGINVQVDADDMPGSGGGTWGDITGTLSSQTDLQTALDAKAALASPTFTGTPAAPTAGAGTNTTQLATTAFVTAALAPYIRDQTSASTASSPITLDMNSQLWRSFVGSATFATPKTMALSNTTNSLEFRFFFEITNVAAVLTFPSDWISADDSFDGTDWTPPLTGKYYMAGDFNDTSNEWTVSIYGPSI